MRRDVSEVKNVCTTKSWADVCVVNVVANSLQKMTCESLCGTNRVYNRLSGIATVRYTQRMEEYTMCVRERLSEETTEKLYFKIRLSTYNVLNEHFYTIP